MLKHRSLYRLIGEFRSYKFRIFVTLVLGILIASIQPAAVKLSELIIDELKQGAKSDVFTWLPWALIGLFVVSGIAKYTYNTVKRCLTEKVIIGFRTRLYEKYLSFPQQKLDQHRMGDLLSTLQMDLQYMQQGLETIYDLLKEPFTFLGLIGFAFYCDPKLTLATLIIAPIVVYLFGITGSAVKRYSSRNLSHFSDLTVISQESIQGSKVIKVFGLESILLQKFQLIQEKFYKTIKKSIRVQELPTPTIELLGAVLMAGVILYGANEISEGRMSPGSLVAFVISLGLCQMPIKQLNMAYVKLKSSEAASERVYRLLDTERESSPQGRKVETFNSRISFKNVSLYYDRKPALQSIQLEVRRGEKLALVGPSGGGKSSLVLLLPRLFDPTQGSIEIDGVDIREIDLKSLRSLFSYVTQDTFLFSDTIYENIRYGKMSATQKEIYEASEQAQCLEFIERCPKGFETQLGDRGLGLSGGEKQRVAIARALLKNAPILILDEATSNLDSYSEKKVSEALDTLMKDKTTFWVAHRFSTIKKADRIAVLDHGKIIEIGNHEELTHKMGVYSNLLSHQQLSL